VKPCLWRVYFRGFLGCSLRTSHKQLAVCLQTSVSPAPVEPLLVDEPATEGSGTMFHLETNIANAVSSKQRPGGKEGFESLFSMFIFFLPPSLPAVWRCFPPPLPAQVFHHAILNLPDSALTFLDTFRGVDWRANGFEAPPTVHVYCFSKAADPRQASSCPVFVFSFAPTCGGVSCAKDRHLASLCLSPPPPLSKTTVSPSTGRAGPRE